MIAPPYSQLRLAGITWTIRPPDTAIEVMECDIFHACNLNEHRSVVPRTQDIEAIQRWCAAYVLAVEGRGAWGDYTDAEKAAVIDLELEWQQVETLRVSICEAAGLPAHIIEDVAALYQIAEGGGCECPICERDKEPTPHLREACLYYGISDDAAQIVNATYALGDAPILHAPWWLYQLQQAQARGRGKARRERMKKKQKREMVDETFKQNGIKT